MTNLDVDPAEILCAESVPAPVAELLAPRDVPLGGLRAMTVRRTLPQRERSLIGAWCFLDHYGPDRVSESGGMRVARHPHTGLATVSLLFTGGIAHRDSTGTAALVRPGEVNLMIAGRGISHQEFSTSDTTILHGVQLWYALPDATRHMPPAFEHYAPEPVLGEGTALRVFLGSLAGSTSPVQTYTPPLVAAEAILEPGARLRLELDPAFEHGVLLDSGDLGLNGSAVPPGHLAYLPVGQRSLALEAGPDRVRLILIGGEPLNEQIVMWWNFVGRSHEEVVAYRAEWQAEIGLEPASASAGVTDDGRARRGRFGPYPEGQPSPIPAPVMPSVRLRPRGADSAFGGPPKNKR
ncbi:pirin family protein [Cryobacterium tepidiphilum]|uniref:Pirin family protein n=1 Tax=Cryobacterium tepidiphilum TaxID=2486026 RepID=A0A3M8LML2_9MICO|nr:pirin family protein [Cryobacterium tepidiphilum]RNE66767.1 pirin family protein [Cryobacterium tepidiphilum]